MQQFARRQPYEPEDDQSKPPVQFGASDDIVAQWMDQLCALQQQVASLTEEVSGIKGENQRLRSQIAAWVANQEAYLGGKPAQEATVEPEVLTTTEVELPAETEAVTPTLEAPSEPVQETIEEKPIDEESLVELARSAGAPIEIPAPKSEPTDDEIQRMLAEVASGATDASPQPVEEPVAEQLPVESTEEPFLHLDQAEPAHEEPEPIVKTEISFEIDRAAVNRVPSHLAIAALAVPVRLEGDAVVCKAVAPFDFASLDLIADAIAGKIVPEAAPIEEVVAALRIAYNDESYAGEREEVWAVSAPEKKRGLFRRSG